MARSDVYLYTDASDPANAVVSAKQDTTAADFPTLVLGDTPLFNFYFTDGTATWPSWAGDAGYSVTWALSDAIAGDESPMAIQTASTPITGGWSMRLPVNTGSLINALQSRRVSQAWPVVQLWSHIRVTDDSGFVVSYALIRTNVRLRAIPDSQQTPNDPLPAGTQYVLADETGALSSPANFLDASGFVTLDGGGKIAASQLPDIALVDYLGLAADEAAMLALSGQLGDWCIREDLSTSWIITGEDPSLLAGWTQIAYPANAVTSVHGRTGTVSAVSTDYSATGITNTAIGATNPSTGAFTTLSATNGASVSFSGNNSIALQGTDGVIYRSGGGGTNAGFHRFRYFDTDVAVVSSTGLAVTGQTSTSSLFYNTGGSTVGNGFRLVQSSGDNLISLIRNDALAASGSALLSAYGSILFVAGATTTGTSGTLVGSFSPTGLAVTGLTTTDTLRINTAPSASVATASTHKVAVNLNGSTYYLLCTT